MIQRLPIAADLVTFDSFVALVGDGQKADLIDGVIYIASPDTRLSNTLNGFLYQLIEGFTAARDIDGFTFMSRFACKINELRAPEPDVGYVRPERIHLVEERHMVGGPDIAVERYEMVALEDNRIFKSEVIPGFWVDVEWLLAKKVPRAFRCLEKILGRGGGKRPKRKT